MSYIPDNYDRWERYDAQKEEWLNRRPVCAVCGHHIQEEDAVNYKGKWYCGEHEDAVWKEVRQDYLERIED